MVAKLAIRWLGLTFATNPAFAQSPAVIAILTAIEHPSLDAVRDGLRDALKDRGLVEGDNLVLIYESAQADPGTAADIARRFAQQRPDVAVAISAPAAEALVPMGDRVSLVITALGPHRAAEIVNGTGDVAGLVQPPPYRQQLELAKTIAPGTVRLIVPHAVSPELDGSIDGVFRDAARQLELTIVPVAIGEEDDPNAVLSDHLAEGAAIWLMREQGIDDAVELFVELAIEQQVPIFADFEDAVTRGAIATIVYDPYDIGRQTGVQVLEILAGQPPGELGLVDARPTRLVLNEDTAERMDLRLPPELRDRARFVVEGPFDRPATRGIPQPVPPPCDGTARCE